MTWRDDLRRVQFGSRTLVGASFRGVPFFVDASERNGGRRTVTHEFPLSDETFTEDLGRSARTFHIEGYVLGDDYLSQRDKLIAALEDEEGPGELVHPYHGVFLAICTTMSVRESRVDGGHAAFAVQFTRTPTAPPAPTIVVDAPAQVSTSADTATAAMDAELVAKYKPAHLPGWSFASAETALKNALAALKDKLSPITDVTQEAAELTGQIALMTAEVSSLVRQPALAISGFRDAITGLTDTIAAAPDAVMSALFDAYAADLGALVDPTTATREVELANQTALIAALRRVLAIEAARLAPLVPYASIEEATAARDQVAAMLDEQAAGADDAAYPAIVDLRSQVLRSVPGGTAFAQVVTVTRNVPIPSLVLAYQLYGSVDLEPDILARNDVRHPGFVVGDLKVLSDG